jgi:hypothetical protein
MCELGIKLRELRDVSAIVVTHGLRTFYCFNLCRLWAERLNGGERSAMFDKHNNHDAAQWPANL